MRILHLISQRPDSTGSGIYLQAMLREAASYGHTNFLVAGIQSDQPVEVSHVDPGRGTFVTFYLGDISYHIVGMSDVMPYDSTRFRDLSRRDLEEYEQAFSTKLEAAVSQFSPDIIHSHHLWIVSSLARRLFSDIPIATSCHGSDLRQFENCPHLRERVLSGCQRLDAVMALSGEQRQEILRLYDLAPAQVSVVGAGYNDALFSPGAKLDSGPVQLVYAGKLSRAKGVPWLLRALSRIDAPDWRLHLVGGGSGEEQDECLSLARRLGRRVHVHGVLPQEALAEIMRQSHVLVLPSFYEGFGLVVLEGLACGCRIVATDLAGIRELVGAAEVDFVELVEPPRLRAVDQPYDEDVGGFEERLTGALRAQLDAARRRPEIDTSPLADRLASYSWEGIFKKVLDVYKIVLDG